MNVLYQPARRAPDRTQIGYRLAGQANISECMLCMLIRSSLLTPLLYSFFVDNSDEDITPVFNTPPCSAGFQTFSL